MAGVPCPWSLFGGFWRGDVLNPMCVFLIVFSDVAIAREVHAILRQFMLTIQTQRSATNEPKCFGAFPRGRRSATRAFEGSMLFAIALTARANPSQRKIASSHPFRSFVMVLSDPATMLILHSHFRHFLARCLHLGLVRHAGPVRLDCVQVDGHKASG